MVSRNRERTQNPYTMIILADLISDSVRDVQLNYTHTGSPWCPPSCLDAFEAQATISKFIYGRTVVNFNNRFSV